MNKWLSKIDYKKVNMIMDAISALSIIGMIVCTFFYGKIHRIVFQCIITLMGKLILTVQKVQC